MEVLASFPFLPLRIEEREAGSSLWIELRPHSEDGREREKKVTSLFKRGHNFNGHTLFLSALAIFQYSITVGKVRKVEFQ